MLHLSVPRCCSLHIPALCLCLACLGIIPPPNVVSEDTWPHSHWSPYRCGRGEEYHHARQPRRVGQGGRRERVRSRHFDSCLYFTVWKAHQVFHLSACGGDSSSPLTHGPRGTPALGLLEAPTFYLPEGTVSPGWRPQLPGFPRGPWGRLPISPGISHSPLVNAQGPRRQRSPQRRRQILLREPKATFNYRLGLCNQTNWTHSLWASSLGLESPPAASPDPRAHQSPHCEPPQSQEEQPGPHGSPRGCVNSLSGCPS